MTILGVYLIIGFVLAALVQTERVEAPLSRHLLVAAICVLAWPVVVGITIYEAFALLVITTRNKVLGFFSYE